MVGGGSTRPTEWAAGIGLYLRGQGAWQVRAVQTAWTAAPEVVSWSSTRAAPGRGQPSSGIYGATDITIRHPGHRVPSTPR